MGRTLVHVYTVYSSLRKYINFTLASSPGSSRFSNVARRERREPDKIYHMSNVVWKGLAQAARARSYASTVKAVALMVATLESTTDRASEERKENGPDSISMIDHNRELGQVPSTLRHSRDESYQARSLLSCM